MAHLGDTDAAFAKLRINSEIPFQGTKFKQEDKGGFSLVPHEASETHIKARSVADEKEIEGNLILPPATSQDSQTAPLIYPKVMTLDVGGRKFQVSRDILELESGLFRRQLSDQYTWTPEPDGSYFLDADPDLFEHILRFMRRPVFPLFYDKAAGFNYDLYNRLEAEAEYFQTFVLRDWIKDKKYLQAVKVVTVYPHTRDMNQLGPTMCQGNQSEDWHVVTRTKKVYLCPRQIAVHRGHPEMCGGACHKRQAENTVEYEDEAYLQVVSVMKEIVFDEKVCRQE